MLNLNPKTRIYFITLIVPFIVALVLIVGDGLKSSNFVDYIIREIKDVWMFAVVGVLTTLLGIRIFSKKINFVDSNIKLRSIYFYWLKLTALVIFCLFILEDIVREYKYGSIDYFEFCEHFGIMILYSLVYFIQIGLIYGILFSVVIRLMINRKWL